MWLRLERLRVGVPFRRVGGCRSKLKLCLHICSNRVIVQDSRHIVSNVSPNYLYSPYKRNGADPTSLYKRLTCDPFPRSSGINDLNLEYWRRSLVSMHSPSSWRRNSQCESAVKSAIALTIYLCGLLSPHSLFLHRSSDHSFWCWRIYVRKPAKRRRITLFSKIFEALNLVP